MFATITKERQKLYEKIYFDNVEFKNNIPYICGYYGRACRQMNDKADRMLCNRCTLSIFISTIESILEICNEKEKLEIKSLYDSDIYDVQTRLKEKGINAEFSYIENILEELIKHI